MRVVSFSVVLLALVATIGVFTFARPQYHPPGCAGCGKQLIFNEAKPPANGWLWADPTPGFHFGEHHDEWRVTSRIAPSDVPAEAGILTALTDSPKHTEAIYWSNGCVGMRLRDGGRARLCNPQAAAAFIVDARPKFGAGWNMFLIGVARSDVTKITAHARGATYVDARGSRHRVRALPPQVVYDARTPGWWGSFEESTEQPVPWELTLKVYNKHGLMAASHVTFDKPGDAFYCASALRGVCGMSAHRRS